MVVVSLQLTISLNKAGNMFQSIVANDGHPFNLLFIIGLCYVDKLRTTGENRNTYQGVKDWMVKAKGRYTKTATEYAEVLSKDLRAYNRSSAIKSVGMISLMQW